MKITLSVILLIMVGHLSVNAQTTDDVTQNINKVKRDNMYIYAEATMKDLNEAYSGARAILEMKVGDWVREKYPSEGIELCIVKAKDHLVQLETRRGDFYRAFVYVKKSDILPVADKGEVTVLEVAPVTHPSKPVASQAIIVEESTSAIVEKAPVLELTPDEKQMKLVKSFYDVEPYIKGLKSRGILKEYGKYATMPANADCYLFVYDKQGNISALLKKSGIAQYNLNTLKEDNVKNYKNCGAIWFQIK